MGNAASGCLPSSLPPPPSSDAGARAAWVRAKDSEDAKRDQLPRFARFRTWLETNGALTNGVDFAFFSGSVRGVHAAVDIAPHTRIITVPAACLIKTSDAVQTPLGKKISSVAAQLTAPDHSQLTCYVLTMHERGNSFHQPFFDVLPTDIENFPVRWDERSIAWLEASSVVHEIAARKQSIQNDYERILTVAPEMERFGFERFLWCRTMVGSRNFSVHVGGVNSTMLVPLADMLNDGGRERDTVWTYSETLDAFTVTSARPIAAGAQITDSYGSSICNTRRLVDWGFAVEDNRREDGVSCNTVQLRFAVLRSPAEGSNVGDGDGDGDGDGGGAAASAAPAKGAAPPGQASVDALLVVRQAAAAAAAAAVAAVESLSIAPHAKCIAVQVASSSVAATRRAQDALVPSASSTACLPASPSNETLFDRRMQILKYSTRVSRVSQARDDDSMRNTLSFLRRSVATHAEIDALRNAWAATQTAKRAGARVVDFSKWVLRRAEKLLSAPNEIRALEALASAASVQLSHFSSTLEDNVAELRSSDLAPFSRRRTALIMIAGEKRLLLFFKELLAACQPILAVSPPDRNAAVGALRAERGSHDAVYRFVAATVSELASVEPAQ